MAARLRLRQLAVMVETIAGVVTGAPAERRRRRTIEQLRDDFVICRYGRVGRCVAEPTATAPRESVAG